MTYQPAETTLTRRLSMFDMDEFARHLLRLDAESRRMRFGSIVTDEFLKDYAARSARWNVILYGHFVGGALRGVAELRPLAGAGSREAELAFSVEKELRGKGVASNLIARLIRAARNRGYRQLHMSCLASNDAMQALARKFGARISWERGGATGIISPGAATPATLVAEAAEEAAAFAIATISLPRWTLADFFRREPKSA